MKAGRTPQTKTGFSRLYAASVSSAKGMAYIWKNEPAFRTEAFVAALSITSALLLSAPPLIVVLLFGSWMIVLVTEVVNTAIEVVVDRISLEIHPLSGAAKDLASLALLLSLIHAVAWWGIALFMSWPPP